MHCTCNSTYPLVYQYTGFICELQHQSTARHPYHCMLHPHQQLNAWLSGFDSILKMMTLTGFCILHTMSFYHTIKHQRTNQEWGFAPSHVWQYTFQHLTLFTKILYTTCQKYQKDEIKWEMPPNILTLALGLTWNLPGIGGSVKYWNKYINLNMTNEKICQVVNYFQILTTLTNISYNAPSTLLTQYSLGNIKK
jgi:hypothetical protein